MSRKILINNPISCFADEIDDNIDKQIALLKELGINQIEFRSGDGKNVVKYTEEEAEVLKSRLDAAGITLSALGSPIGKIGINDDFEPHFEEFKHCVKLAKILNTRYIRMFSFYIPEGEDPYSYRGEVLARLKKMVDYAAENDIVLLHENEKGIYGDNAERCRDLMGQFYGDAFGCTFDFANFIQVHQDTLEAWETLKEFVQYIHVKDALSGSGHVVPAGKGDGHLRTILGALDHRQFNGVLSLEPHLADFSGFIQLEREGAALERTDNEHAFVTAYEALMGLLN